MLRDLVREQESGHLRQEVDLISAIVTDRAAAGGDIDRQFLESLVGKDSRLEFESGKGRTVVVRGEEYAGSDNADAGHVGVRGRGRRDASR